MKFVDLSSDKQTEIQKSFDEFKANNDKKYNGSSEETQRKDIFAENYLIIQQNNTSNTINQMQINKYSDLSIEELYRTLGFDRGFKKVIKHLPKEKKFEIKTAFLNFKKENNRLYSSFAEDKIRFAIFAKNFLEVEEHNKSDSTYKMGINQFSDMTEKEFKSTMLGGLRTKDIPSETEM